MDLHIPVTMVMYRCVYLCAVCRCSTACIAKNTITTSVVTDIALHLTAREDTPCATRKQEPKSASRVRLLVDIITIHITLSTPLQRSLHWQPVQHSLIVKTYAVVLLT